MQFLHTVHCVVFHNRHNQHWYLIGTYFVYYKYMNHNKKTAPRYDYFYQAANY